MKSKWQSMECNDVMSAPQTLATSANTNERNQTSGSFVVGLVRPLVAILKLVAVDHRAWCRSSGHSAALSTEQLLALSQLVQLGRLVAVGGQPPRLGTLMIYIRIKKCNSTRTTRPTKIMLTKHQDIAKNSLAPDKDWQVNMGFNLYGKCARRS